MAKNLFKLLLLGALSLGASNLPGMLGGLSALPSGEVPDLAVPKGSDESSAELRRELAGVGETMADLKGLTQGAKVQAAAGLSDEERELMQDAAPQLKFRSNALTRQVGLAPGGAGGAALPGNAGKLLKSLKSQKGPQFQSFSDLRGDLLRFYYSRQAAMAYALWLIPAGAVVLSFLLFLCKRYTLSMLLTSFLFTLAALPRELWLSPVVFLVVAAGMLHLADENYPFWNRTLSTLFTPIAASLLAAGWPQGMTYVKTLLGSAAAKV